MAVRLRDIQGTSRVSRFAVRIPLAERSDADCHRPDNREKDQTWDDGVQGANRVLVSGAVCPHALKSVSSAHCLADPPLSEAQEGDCEKQREEQPRIA